MIKTLSLLLLISCLNVFAVIDHTVKPTGGDYNTLSGAVEHIKATHASFSDDMTITISGDWTSTTDTTEVHLVDLTFNGYSLTILATGDSKHSGIYAAKNYYLNADLRLRHNAGNVICQDFCAKKTIIGAYASPNITLQRMILRNTAGQATIVNGDSLGTGTTNIYNCIIYSTFNDNYNDLAVLEDTSYTFNLLNCTFDAGGYGNVLKINSTTLVQNCVTLNHGDSGRVCFITAGSFNASNDYNTSDDTTSAGANSTDSVTPTFVSEAGHDYHLAVADTVAKDTGVDLSGTFTDDIDGVARGATFDRGADEYVAAAASGYSGQVI
jgi:hypothetical protein